MMKISKKVLKKGAFVLAGATLVAVATPIAIHYHKKPEIDPNEMQNQVGYTNIKPISNYTSWKVKENNFVVLDAGDFNDNGVWFLNQKIKYCNKKDISLGIIVSSDSYSEDKIYEDVDYVKALISKYKVDFPVYLDINKIINNDDLNVEAKTKLIRDFLDRLSADNIRVGIYGTDSNLVKLYEFLEVYEYSAYLVKETNDIKYKGQIDLIQQLDGTITNNHKINGNSDDLAKYIGERNYNKSDNFKSDAIIPVSRDNISDLAMKYGWSTNELLKFNDLNKRALKEKTYLRVPSIISNNITKESYTYKSVPEGLKGCDISYAQGKTTDWDKVKSNFDFIIVRCANGTRLDNYFHENAKNCNLNNIPMGVYTYNAYTKKNCETLEDFCKNERAQARYTLNILRNKKIDYPVYLDIEGFQNSDLPKEYVSSMLEIWYESISNAGYLPGLYFNQSDCKYIQGFFEEDLSNKFEIWIAGGPQYSGGKETYELSEIENPKDKLTVTKPACINVMQATDCCVNSGVSNKNGFVDVNISLVDYSKKEYIDSKNSKLKKSEKISKEATLGIALLVAGGLSGMGAYFYIDGEKKEKNKKEKL